MSQIIRRIRPEEVVQLTSELIRIPSENPPGDQRAVSEFIESKIRDLGLVAEAYDCRPDKPNVVGLLSGKKRRPVLMLNGHVDTVPVGDKESWEVDPHAAVVKEGRIFGRGAADMKGGLAAMLMAAKAIVEAGVELSGTLMLAAVVDEEVPPGGLGTRDLLEKGYRSDYAIIGEPTELRVQTAHKGALWLEVTTKGKSAHSSTPRLGVNAIYGMSKLCLLLEAMLPELEKNSHPLVGNPSINVGTIQGGTSGNTVPELCRVVVDRRLIPGEKLADVKESLNRVLEKVRIENPQLRIETRVLVEGEPSETSAGDPIVKASREAVMQVKRKDPGVTGFTATCDMRLLVAKGIPTVILGPGSLNQAHKANEFVEIQQVVDAARIYALTAEKLLV
jgi:acetylornithine deacetylase/succinyl-diaminopimelate desuccinylase family protein